MRNLKSLIAVCLGMAFLVAGCTNKADNQPAPAASGASFLLSTQPADAKSVIDVVSHANGGDAVAVIGRIGGSEDPWVKDVAAFDLVDTSLIPCSEMEGDSCKTPWDYCCQLNALPGATLTVKVVGADGQPVQTDARQLLGVKELQTVVVRGKVKKDAGALVVLADGVFLP